MNNQETIRGSRMLVDGPRLKYIFGARNFDVTRWNLQVDEQMEAYWRRFPSLKTLEDHAIDKHDYGHILNTLIKCGVSFWVSVKGDPKVDTWQELDYRPVSGDKLKEKIRSPVQSSRNRVIQSLRKMGLPAVSADVPYLGFDQVPVGEAGGAELVPSAPISAPMQNRSTSTIGLLSGSLFLRHDGESSSSFKYILGTVDFAPVTPWNEQVDAIALNYWRQFPPEGLERGQLSDAVRRMHTALYSRRVSFYRAEDGPRSANGALLPIGYGNWQDFDYMKVKDNEEIDQAIQALMKFTKDRVMAACRVPPINEADFSSCSSLNLESGGVSSRNSSQKSRSVPPPDDEEIAIDDTVGTFSAMTMNTTPFPDTSVSLNNSQQLGLSSQRNGSLMRERSILTMGSTSVSMGTVPDGSHMSAISNDFSHMSVLDELIDDNADKAIRRVQLEP